MILPTVFPFVGIWGDIWMHYEWDDKLSTGHEKIDRQHKQLIEALNRLIEACSSGEGSAELGNTLEFLNSYIMKHFSDEEKIMQEYGYPDYQRHKGYHDDFTKVVRGLTDQLLSDGPTDQLVGMVHSKIASWLTNHIKGEDFRLAAHVKAH
jgi:hemerythrin